jgi:hypothetical protein
VRTINAKSPARVKCPEVPGQRLDLHPVLFDTSTWHQQHGARSSSQLRRVFSDPPREALVVWQDSRSQRSSSLDEQVRGCGYFVFVLLACLTRLQAMPLWQKRRSLKVGLALASWTGIVYTMLWVIPFMYAPCLRIAHTTNTLAGRRTERASVYFFVFKTLPL